MAQIYPKTIHPDAEVAELEQRLADLAATDLTARERAAHQRPLERKLEAAQARQAARQRQDDITSPRELAAQVSR